MRSGTRLPLAQGHDPVRQDWLVDLIRNTISSWPAARTPRDISETLRALQHQGPTI